MIAQYYGTSWASRTIQAYQAVKLWMPDSPTHTAFIDDERPQVIEAWQANGPSGKSGVQVVPSLDTLHTPGTRVELYRVIGQTPDILNRVRDGMLSQVGKPYDWPGILGGFGFHREQSDPDKAWFCSELVAYWHAQANLPLLQHIPAYKVPPALLHLSPLLRLAGVWVCGQGIVERRDWLPDWLKGV